MVFRFLRRGAARGGGAARGQGAGRRGGPLAAGPGGTCLCPSCGHRMEHQRTKPCYEQECPQCGTRMVRE